MPTINFSIQTICWTAIATGITGLLSLIFLILFFTVGQPFGTLNDIFIGIAGILSGILAWMMYVRHDAQSPLLSQAGLTLASAGVIVVVIGSVLVIFGIKGWYLAGLYMAAGNAMIGLWLLGLNISVQQSHPWPHSLVIFGIATGLMMALGLFTVPGIFKNIDSWDAASWTINYIGLPSAVGYLALYPIWCIFLGRSLLK
jgi:hypothetical protein